MAELGEELAVGGGEEVAAEGIDVLFDAVDVLAEEAKGFFV